MYDNCSTSLATAGYNLNQKAADNNGIVISTITISSGEIKYVGPVSFDANPAGITGSSKVYGYIDLPTLGDHNSSEKDQASRDALKAYATSVANSTVEAGPITIRMEVCSAGAEHDALSIEDGAFTVEIENAKVTGNSSANRLEFTGDFVSGGIEAGDMQQTVVALKKGITV